MKPIIRTLGSLFLLFLLTACGPTAPAPTTGIDQVPSPVPPTAKVVVPTAVPTVPMPGPTPVPAAITITSPLAGTEVASPVAVQGMVAVVPFESNLRGRVYDTTGQVLGEGPITVQGSMGDPGPAPFSGEIAFQASTAGPAKIEIAEISPKDGSVIEAATVQVNLQIAAAPAGAIEVPATGISATLPLHILAHVGRPGDQVIAALRWQDGSVLTRTYTLLEGQDGRGLLVEGLWWQADVPPLPFPPTQPATLEIRADDGTVLAQQQLTVLSWDDEANVQQVTVYFLLGEELQAVTRVVPRTIRIGTAALEELLWGPPPPNLAGFTTALPQPADVLAYPGQGPDWGPRVRLLELTIENGVATANFSREFRAYGGGSLRVTLIREQIARTLLEFPTVQEVVIAVEWETEGVLEP
jgi:hypothetical protein